MAEQIIDQAKVAKFEAKYAEALATAKAHLAQIDGTKSAELQQHDAIVFFKTAQRLRDAATDLLYAKGAEGVVWAAQDQL